MSSGCTAKLATQIAPLPQPPTGFGLDNLPIGAAFGPLAIGATARWGAMFNDSLLTCVEASFIHSIMHWTYAATGQMAPFVETDGRDLYSTLTGYVIGDPSTDHGTDDFVGFDYWMNTGIYDDDDVNHKLLSLYRLPTGDVDTLAQAVYLCGAAYVGFNLSVAWEQTLLNSAIWDTIASPTMTGNTHTVPVIGRSTNGNFIVVTFGGLVQLTPAGFRQFTTGSFAMVSEDWINPDTGKAPNGYTTPQIQQYMQALTPMYAPTMRISVGMPTPTVVEIISAPVITVALSMPAPTLAEIVAAPVMSVSATMQTPTIALIITAPTMTVTASMPTPALSLPVNGRKYSFVAVTRASTI